MLSMLLMDAFMLFIPLSIGFAVLRSRLFDIDVVINRTLVYGSLTAILAGVYFGGVTATQAIFRALTSQEEQPQLAIVVSTLVIAALFNPLRRRIQGFIDRRFYRSKYDAAKTLEAFSAKLRDETDLDTLSDDLVGVVQETLQPAHVSLWLRPDTASRALCSDIGPMLLPTSDRGHVCHPRAYGAMLKNRPRRGGPISLTTALRASRQTSSLLMYMVRRDSPS